MAAADREAGAEARLPLVAKMIDHIIVNPMALAKLRGARLGARHSGQCNYHLSIHADIALRSAPPVRVASGRSRDYRRVQPQYVEGPDGKQKEVPAWTYVRQALLGELDNLRERIQDDPPYDRAAALAQRMPGVGQFMADACLPPKLAPHSGDRRSPPSHALPVPPNHS